MTAHPSAHYCAAVLTPFAYTSPYFTMTLTLIVSLSYIQYLVVYRLAYKGHSHFRLGLLCNPRTINHPQSLHSSCSPLEPSFTLYLLALVLQNASLLSDLTPVRVSFAIKSLATLVIRVDS